MKKRILGLMLGLCLVIGALSGCGSEDENSSRKGEEAGQNTTAQTDASNQGDQAGGGQAEGDQAGGDQTEEKELYLAKETVHNMSFYYDYITEYEYDEQGNTLRKAVFEGDKTDYTREEYEYDTKGNLLRERTEVVSGSQQSRTVETEYEYDATGKLLRSVSNSNNAYYEQKGITEVLYEYDAAGNLVKKSQTESYAMGGDDFDLTTTSWTEYEYDTAGNLLKENHYDEWHPDSPDEWTEYVYDSAGNLIKEGNDSRWHEYEYDAAGNLLMDAGYDGGLELDRTEYEYDGAGNLTKSRNYLDEAGNGKIILMGEYEYDADGNQVLYRFYYSPSQAATSEVPVKAGSLAGWAEYTYDGDGNRIGTVSYNADGSIASQYEPTYSTEEELDEAGHLIKSTSYVDGEITSWTEYEYK